MGALGRALRVAAGASRAALRPLEAGRLRLRDRALPGTLPLPLTRTFRVDRALQHADVFVQQRLRLGERAAVVPHHRQGPLAGLTAAGRIA